MTERTGDGVIARHDNPGPVTLGTDRGGLDCRGQGRVTTHHDLQQKSGGARVLAASGAQSPDPTADALGVLAVSGAEFPLGTTAAKVELSQCRAEVFRQGL